MRFPAVSPYNLKSLCRALSQTVQRQASGNGELLTVDALTAPFRKAGLPLFSAQSKDIRVLHEPKDFYNLLLHNVRSAKERIFLSSLYIGKEDTQLASLVEALHQALAANPNLRLSILVDYLRSTREHTSPSSASLICGLSARFPEQVSIGLWHTPELYGWRNLTPNRLNEGWGLQHMKCYGFDDRVIMSGANLSSDYFTNRQDRYISFENNSTLANYFFALQKLFIRASYALKGRSTAKNADFDLVWNGGDNIPSPQTNRSRYVTQLAYQLEEVVKTKGDSSTEGDTFVIPNLQMGSFGIKQETESVIPTILELEHRLADRQMSLTVDWTSGYFSVRPEDQEMILQNQDARFRIVSASPEANGFLNSKGVSRHVPPAYMHLEQQFYDAVRRAGRDSIEIKEWKREGWTYHSKGIWLSPSNGNPFLTLVGSSNYGRRSATRDLEANLLLLTLNEGLRRSLRSEVENIRKYATVTINEELVARPERQVHWGVQIAARCISTML
ncbi:hypothetical protein BT69DRAFT_1256954 [Atractiella rhizophila]|nr:hypothetical protein BT69DRAFT_1256954 [Atractiella rhizophila]